MTQELRCGRFAALLPEPIDDNSGSLAAVTVDRRYADDRRGGIWLAFMYGNFRPRRRNSRRTCEAHFYCFDWHEPRILYLALGILLLSCTDALFTLNLVHAGAAEANPVMASMLAVGIDSFVIGKIGITAFSLLILVFAARRKFVGPFSVEHVLQSIFAGYLLLICYEVYMFWYVFELNLSPRWLVAWMNSLLLG